MLYAVRGNKQLKIGEAEKNTYLAMGYDIAQVDGNKLEIIQHSPSKTVPYADYKKLQDENETLKDEIAALQEQLAEPGKKTKGDK
ncbi:hypothetical protein [Paenibacillus dendritiformis]|uniref:Uncharacterized protein n=1 Tax=Paenibacillus dendritiformis C454 TaxID=1131935 RepID=H3SAB0_9BACL|nr:hypothetical protein [Paenibacillus dendritiformis]EHQ63913.1 hypothetical protein PDENDC454_02215 [Paenibacillus dendritiformis C454]CAH8772235.1 DivIVA domain-containing protein [Paenibacillus dendritiformis]